MFLVHVATRILEIIFFTGMVGSAAVVIISFVEDLHELIGKEEALQPPIQQLGNR